MASAFSKATTSIYVYPRKPGGETLEPNLLRAIFEMIGLMVPPPSGVCGSLPPILVPMPSEIFVFVAEDLVLILL